MAKLNEPHSMVELLTKGFQAEFEKEVIKKLEIAEQEFHIKVANIVAQAKKTALANSQKAAIDLLAESNFALYDLRFSFKKD